MFISFIFCLFFKVYEYNNFLILFLDDLLKNKSFKVYNKIFVLDSILQKKHLNMINEIYKSDDKYVSKYFFNFLQSISIDFYYNLVTNIHITTFIENIDLYIELSSIYNDKKLVFKLLVNFFILILCIDFKHIGNHGLEKNVLKNILNINSFVLIFHYYKGVGGDESGFFIRDYDVVMEKIVKYLIQKKVFSIIEVKEDFRKYLLNLKLIDYESFCILFMMAHEGPVVRVQREPVNDSKKIHTSTIGVLFVCMPIISNVVSVLQNLMDSKYIRVDVFRASGAGGQHVNKTSSAVRLTHILFNISVVSQDERSQIANRKNALDRLKEKIYKDFSDGASLFINSHFLRLHRSMKSETFNYKRNMIHFHDNFIKNSINISIDLYRDHNYFLKVFNKFLNFLF